METEAYDAALEAAAARHSPEKVFRVTGDDAADYLERLVTTPVEDLETGETRRTMLLSTEGRSRALLRLHRTDDGFHVASSRADSLRDDWRGNVFREDVEFHPARDDLVEIRGPTAREHAPETAVEIDTPMRGVDALPEDDGVENILDELPVLDAEAAKALRVEAGVAADPDLHGRVPLAAADDLVGFERCYPGQEVVARVAQRGGGPSERFVGFTLEDEPETRESASGAADLTSVAESPRFGWIALGYLDDDADDEQAFDGVDAEAVEPPFDPEVKA